MHNVEPKPIYTAKPDQQADGGQLRLIGTGAQPGCVLPPVARIAAVVKIIGQLRVDQERQAGASQLRQRSLQFIRRDHGEPWKAGIHQEAFKPGRTCRRQARKMCGVLSRQSSPRHPVYVALASGGGAFRLECNHRCSFG